MKLTTLPRHAGENALTGRLEPFVGIAGDHLHAMQASFDQRGEKFTPMNFGFGKRDAHAQLGPFSIWQDPHRYPHLSVDNAAAVSDFFIAGIDDQIGELAQRPLPP